MSNEKPRKVLVVGASGKQGGAAARALLARGHAVRAMTRDPESPRLAELRAAGVEVVRGDLLDAASLQAAMTGVDAAFGMTTPFEKGEETEVAQGEALVDAARATKLPHLVFSSVGGADKRTGIPHFDSKHEVESYLWASGVPATILGPVYFMENLFFPQNIDHLRKGVYGVPMSAGRSLQQVAVEDIGRFAAAMIEGGAKYHGRRYDLAGDDLTGTRAAELLSAALGKPVQFQEIPIAVIRSFSDDMARMYEWFERAGYDTDIAALRAEFPDVGFQRYDQWLAKQPLAKLLG